MTAKKEAYSGPLLASDMSAVRRGRGRAGRCEHRAVPSEQSGGWESDPGRQPLRSKYQHRRTKWRPWPRHMTRAPPLRAIPLSAGRGRHGPGTPPSGPLTPTHCVVALPAWTSAPRPTSASSGALSGAAGLSNPAALGPSGLRAGAGRWRAILAYGAGLEVSHLLCGCAALFGVRFRASFFFAFSVCRLAEEFSLPSPRGPRTAVYPERPYTSWGDLRVQAGGAEILCLPLPPTPTPPKPSPDSSRPTRPRPSNW